jgi:type VI protein secretion system component VasF
VFYDTLDDLMLKPQTLPFVLAVFYLCLNNGFVGRYAGNQARRNEYLERLRAKIPLAETGEFDDPADEIGQLQDYRSPAWYYGTAGAVLLAIYFIFLGVARIYNPLQ